MNREPVESSMIASAGYNAEARILEVEFNSGRVYEYYDVPPELYSGLIAAGSKGGFMHENVIDLYSYGEKRRRYRS